MTLRDKFLPPASEELAIGEDVEADGEFDAALPSKEFNLARVFSSISRFDHDGLNPGSRRPE